MNINYIITCGTSQLDVKKLRPAFDNGDDRIKAWIEKDWEGTDPAAIEKMDNVIKHLSTAYQNQHLETPNPLGAELSTLKLLRQEQPKGPKDTETFKVLASESSKGKLAATILTKTLLELEMKGDMETVRYLNDKPRPDRVNIAMCSLVEKFYKSLLAEANNKLIITGGFKSILPCATLFATLNGLDMYYLFEDSNCLQSLQPTGQSLKNADQRHEWINHWKNTLYKNGVKVNNWIVELFSKGSDNHMHFG